MNGPTRASSLTWRRAIAMAVAEQLETRVLAGWRYLDAFRSLSLAGVPGKDIRHALDREPVTTQAGTAVEGWIRYGERGALVLCDAKDSGKTYAAVHWALSRHREGLATLWISGGKISGLSLDDRAVLLRKAHDADALVFDDLGAGTTTHEGKTSAHGGYFRKQLEGLLHDRAQRPTLITSNMNQGETEAYLGPKITSRMTESGGVIRIELEQKLRTTDPEDADPRTGHGEAWRRARALVDAVGCERVRRWVWADDMVNGEYHDTFDVGRKLEGVARFEIDRVWSVSDEHALDRGELHARALELADKIDEDQKIGRLQKQAVAMRLARIQSNVNLADDCYRTLATMKARPSGTAHPSTHALPAKPHPAYTGTDGIGKMKALGFEVRMSSSGASVYDGGGTMKLHKCGPTSSDGWQACARLLAAGW